MKKLLWALAFGLIASPAFAQAPSGLPGCVYNATPPTLSDKQQTVWQCDINGKLITSGGGGGGGSPGGSNTQLQYNNSGSFGGITGATTNGTAVTLVAPVLGTPASGTLTNATGLPISTGVSGLGTGVATFLATPSSANLATAVTDETGSAGLVFANTPTLVTPVLGAATATSVVASGMLQAGTTLGISTDTLLSRDAAGTLAQVNGANAQAMRWYETFTDVSNNAYAEIADVSNVWTLRTVANGTGTVRAITIQPATAAAGLPVSIIGSAATTSGNSGGGVVITGGAGNGGTGGTGGDVTITAGNSGAGTSSRGGNVAVTSGNGTGSQSGGPITLTTGDNVSSNSNGGLFTIITGTNAVANGTGRPGSISITTGVNTATSAAAPGAGATINIAGGAARATSSTTGTGAAGGAFTITGSAGGAATASSGAHTGGAGSSVTITSGAGGNATAGGTPTGGAAGTLALATGAIGTGSTANGAAAPITMTVNGTETFRVAADLTSRIVKSFTVSTLPSCGAGIAGEFTYVTDALTPTFLGVLVGGSSTVTPVFCNGTAWVSY